MKIVPAFLINSENTVIRILDQIIVIIIINYQQLRFFGITATVISTLSLGLSRLSRGEFTIF